MEKKTIIVFDKKRGTGYMVNTGRVKLLFFSLTIFFVCIIFFASIIPSQADSFSVIQEKLDKITEEEREILQNLFTLTEEIEEIEKEEEVITQEIIIMNEEIQELERLFEEEEKAYGKKQDVLKGVLKSYQRRGPGSFIEILLNSDSLTMFLRRLNTLRDITRNTGELLEMLEESKDKLSREEEKLAEKLLVMEEKQEQLGKSMIEKVQLKKDEEDYLASLEDEKEYYQENLIDIQQMWNALKPLFSESTKEFSRIIQDSNLPPEAIKTSFSFFRIKGTIDEKTFNDIIEEHSTLPQMKISFNTEKMTIHMPEQNLILIGRFIIVEKDVLKFEAKEGSFYGISLGEASINELFQDGDLTLDLEPLLGGSTIDSVIIKEGTIEQTIIPKLF